MNCICHLYRNVEDLGDTHHRDRLSVAGESIRKLLKGNARRKLLHSQVEFIHGFMSYQSIIITLTSGSQFVIPCPAQTAKAASKQRALAKCIYRGKILMYNPAITAWCIIVHYCALTCSSSRVHYCETEPVHMTIKSAALNLLFLHCNVFYHL